jgi:hypothetical protein
MASDSQHHDDEEVRSWAGDFDPLADPDERRVLFAALDSFRYGYVLVSSLFTLLFTVCTCNYEGTRGRQNKTEKKGRKNRKRRDLVNVVF